jgi:hypothetical protein
VFAGSSQTGADQATDRSRPDDADAHVRPQCPMSGPTPQKRVVPESAGRKIGEWTYG